MNEIKAADKVQLIPRGPVMTVNFVENLGDGEEAGCVWFDGKNEKREGRFRVTSLRLVKKMSA
jgi:uncharacterized protein YodC (DUF2158 family)